MNIRDTITNDIYNCLNQEISKSNIVVENPKDRDMGDYAIPCFSFSKILKKNPIEIADIIKEKLDNKLYEKVYNINGYLNIFVNKKEVTKYVIEKVLTEKHNYGNTLIGKGKTIVIDYSSPNIAKSFGIGHLRSTVIGNALKNICIKNGFKVKSINYLGDYGTQFGKLIYAYKNFGDEKKVKENPIAELKKLYVKFHSEAEKNPSLEEEGRKYFKLLEEKDEECLKLWSWFREESLKEFQKTYNLLGIDTFDSYNGEAYYNDKMDSVINELSNKKLLKISDGATIVELDDIIPALIKRSDGASLYITRDLAAAFDRKELYNFDEALYVVGNEQALHINQLKQVLSKMGYTWSQDIHHINFGMILQNGKKMSTRKGKTIDLKEVLEEAIDLAKTFVNKRNIAESNLVSQQIGVGAVIFNDLKNYRINDFEFNFEEILNFTGETGPYIQYTNARICSLLAQKENLRINYSDIDINKNVWNIIFRIFNFEEVIKESKYKYDPSKIAKYLLDLAQDFNKMYAVEKFISEQPETTEFNLTIAQVTSLILEEGMRLLGIEMPSEM